MGCQLDWLLVEFLHQGLDPGAGVPSMMLAGGSKQHHPSSTAPAAAPILLVSTGAGGAQTNCVCFGAQLCVWGGCQAFKAATSKACPPPAHQTQSQTDHSHLHQLGVSNLAFLSVHVQKLKQDLSHKQGIVCTPAFQECSNLCHQKPNPNSMDGRCLLEADQAHTPPHMVGFNPNHLRGSKCQTLTFTPRHSFVLTMLQKYANTRKHRASLPNPQEPP
jgi:hypothetical protein